MSYTFTRNNVTDSRESEEKESRQKEDVCVLENKAGEKKERKKMEDKHETEAAQRTGTLE